MIKGLIKVTFFSVLFVGLTACSAASQSGNQHVTVGTGADVAASAS